MSDPYLNASYSEARARFDAFATMDEPEQPDDALDAIQVTALRWAVRWWGVQDANVRALKLTEECGEFVEALGRGPDVAEHVGLAEARESILTEFGDVGICCAIMAAGARCAFSSVWDAAGYLARRRRDSLMRGCGDDGSQLLVAVGRLCRIAGRQMEAGRSRPLEAYRAKVFGELASVLGWVRRMLDAPAEQINIRAAVVTARSY